MQVQTYRKQVDVAAEENISSPSTSLALPDEQLKQFHLRTEKLGLKMVADTTVLRIDERLSSANLLFDRLSGRKLRRWRYFLPTTYRLKDYSYDRPPDVVLSAIEDAISLGIFQRIEIWTDEGSSYKSRTQLHLQAISSALADASNAVRTWYSNSDPMAVGIIEDLYGNEHYFPIVRWGEALRSEAGVIRRNLGIKAALAATFIGVPALYLAVFVLFMYKIISILPNTDAKILGGIGIGIGCLIVSVLLFLAIRGISKLWRNAAHERRQTERAIAERRFGRVHLKDQNDRDSWDWHGIQALGQNDSVRSAASELNSENVLDQNNRSGTSWSNDRSRRNWYGSSS